jgi:ABC-type multidrug transport system fused ATPase/permease subunit
MHRITQREFGEYTVIMISHRLNIIIRLHNIKQAGLDYCEGFFNRMLVIDAGTIAEDGHPTHLLNNMNSRFGAL